MTFRGFTKSLSRAKKILTVRLLAVGTIFTTGQPNGLCLTLVAEDGTRAMIEMETAEWRRFKEMVDGHLEKTRKEVPAAASK